MTRRCAVHHLPYESFIRPAPGGRERVLDALANLRAFSPCPDWRAPAVELAPNLYLSGQPNVQHQHEPFSPPHAFEHPGFVSSPLPFWTPKYEGTLDEVAEALDQDVDNDELAKISKIKLDGVSLLLHHRCHTQGIAMGAGRVITSCMEKSANTNFDGFLQVFEAPIESGAVADIEINLRDDLPGDRWAHAAVGQGVLGKAVVLGDGTFAPDEIGLLVPVTNDHSDEGVPAVPFDGAPTDLRDRNGQLVSRHWHRTHHRHQDDGRATLQTPALVVFHDRLYLIGVHGRFLYVYEIHWFGAANLDAGAAWELLVKLDVRDATEVKTQKLDGTFADWPDYSCINPLLTEDGRVYLLCSHKNWLDTWHLGVLNPPPGQKPTLTKLAIMHQGWWWSNEDLFEQGVAVFRHPTNPRKVGFMAAPWDYRHSRCPSVGADMCTNLWVWDREF